MCVCVCALAENQAGRGLGAQEFLRIQVPNQKEDLLVKLVARCWERGMYLVGAVENPALPDPYMVRGFQGDIIKKQIINQENCI